MKVLLLGIATEGGIYDAMKAVQARHKAGLPEGWAHKFVYGAGYAGARPDEGDVVVDGVEESLVPGVMRKTLAALRRERLEEYDYVVRTNLSTIWLWPRLAALLESAPRTGFSAGTTDRSCGRHMCGCGLIWSADVAARLATDPDIGAELEASREPDDVALSAAAARLASCTPIARLDSGSRVFPACVLHAGALHWSECVPGVTHVRFRSADRALDTVIMDCFQEVVEARPDTDLMLALHVAQVMACAVAC